MIRLVAAFAISVLVLIFIYRIAETAFGIDPTLGEVFLVCLATGVVVFIFDAMGV